MEKKTEINKPWEPPVAHNKHLCSWDQDQNLSRANSSQSAKFGRIEESNQLALRAKKGLQCHCLGPSQERLLHPLFVVPNGRIDGLVCQLNSGARKQLHRRRSTASSPGPRAGSGGGCFNAARVLLSS